MAQRADRPPHGYTRLRLLIAYNGPAFDGWQSQPSGKTVQDELERAFGELVGHRVVVHGSGRTDAGVHALGQVAHADVPTKRLSPDAWTGALNSRLRSDLRVLKTSMAPKGFHARFSATGKIYSYRIWNDRVFHPLEIGRAWHCPFLINIESLQAASALLAGTHDFAPFSAKRHNNEACTVRSIRKIGVKKAGALITLRFEGNGFLYRMVRILTGSLVRVAQGKADANWLLRLLENPKGPRSSFCADADGLYLERVLYRRGEKVPLED